MRSTTILTNIIITDRCGMPIALKADAQPMIKLPHAYDAGTTQKNSTPTRIISGSSVNRPMMSRRKRNKHQALYGVTKEVEFFNLMQAKQFFLRI